MHGGLIMRMGAQIRTASAAAALANTIGACLFECATSGAAGAATGASTGAADGAAASAGCWEGAASADPVAAISRATSSSFLPVTGSPLAFNAAFRS